MGYLDETFSGVTQSPSHNSEMEIFVHYCCFSIQLKGNCKGDVISVPACIEPLLVLYLYLRRPGFLLCLASVVDHWEKKNHPKS